MPCILLDYPGIKGDSLFTNYKDMIVCETFEMVSGKREVGGFEYGDSQDDDPVKYVRTLYGEAAEPVDKRNLGVDSLKLTRRLDIASPKLMQAAFTDPVKEVTATLYFFLAVPDLQGGASGNDFLQPYLTITLKKTQITQYDLSISDGSDETIALAFDELSMTFVQYVDGRKIGQIRGDITMAS
ncbi:type VI secretion system tube protein Hcp [Azospirillum canadense]|uniref:type VI secretion system tube protein Hcp n=1 Tax=Azospirillum canadense TaxID=403962 RepID=UPI002226F375|nr:type VI secretion system tube protein Hcp [Azospirillum canadense]MCW2242981.1 type VI protein secretion system component Hcp [Azospirillum canadense]